MTTKATKRIVVHVRMSERTRQALAAIRQSWEYTPEAGHAEVEPDAPPQADPTDGELVAAALDFTAAVARMVRPTLCRRARAYAAPANAPQETTQGGRAGVLAGIYMMQGMEVILAAGRGAARAPTRSLVLGPDERPAQSGPALYLPAGGNGHRTR